MSNIRVKNGTAVGTRSLCHSCLEAHIIRAYRESEELVFCNYVWSRVIPITFPVRECSNHRDMNVPTDDQMEKFALLIEPASTHKNAGFRKSEELHEVAEKSGTEE